MTISLLNELFFKKVQVFSVGKSEPPSFRIQSSERPQPVYEAPLNYASVILLCVLPQNIIIWNLFLQKWTCYGTELRRNASTLCASTTLTLSERHNISTEWCSSLLCRCHTTVLRPNDSKLFNREFWPNSLASTFTKLDFMWLHYTGIFEKISDLRARYNHKWTEK